jgi:glycosyltransferase involved in cell wall biosynthesis
MAHEPLHVALDAELPEEIAVGRGTALFVCGWCVHPSAAVTDLWFVLGDEPPQPVTAFGMPRLDPFRALHPSLDPYATDGLTEDPDSAADPGLLGYRSGFWGMVRISGPRPDGELQLGLRARLDNGGEVTTRLATLNLCALPSRPPAPAAGAAEVVVAMATYDPPEDLLRRQLDSIRAQTHTGWHCVISDDCSSPAGQAALERAVGGDPRFTVSRSPRRLGFYRNFERALTLVPAGAAFVALSDQDDSWHPDKLATLVAEIGPAQLIYSDARVVSRDGEEISPTWWSTRRNNHTDVLSQLVANSVTGAASLLRGELLDDALPFPPGQFHHYHDHWLGLLALCLGEVGYVDRPLFDYVQHAQASLGHEASNRMPSFAERLRSGRSASDRVRLWRLHYFADASRLNQLIAVLELRLGDRVRRPARRALRRFAAAETSLPALTGLAARGARELTRDTPETLGAEWMLAYAFAWRRLLSWTTRDRPQRRLRLDALPPTTLRQAAHQGGLPERVREVADKIAPLRWEVVGDGPERINLLIPTIDLRHFFAGYIGKLNLAARLADAGATVRIVTVDPVGPQAPDWRARIEAYAGLGGVFDRLEVVFGREAGAIAIGPGDRFVATTWWTAHIARDAVSRAGGEAAGRFLYLIQEYEPFTFPMGTWAALAAESYTFPHVALFSSQLLRGYFRAHRLGVYAGDDAAGDDASRSFENAITDVPAPAAEQLRRDGAPRLLVYARPEDHAARNMFDLALLALSRALARGAFSGWELHGIGTVEGARQLELGGGAVLSLLPRTEQARYAELLRAHDVGLALMYTPHPSLVPIEMAAAGMLAVTNSFENKDAAALAAISPNLVCAAPNVESVADALLAASEAVGDVERRAEGAAATRWSRDWNEAFDDELLAWVRERLSAG